MELSKSTLFLQGIYVLGSDKVGEIPPLRSLSKEAPEDWKKSSWLSGDSVIHIPYSSGTTGLPKGVELTSRNWLSVICVSG